MQRKKDTDRSKCTVLSLFVAHHVLYFERNLASSTSFHLVPPQNLERHHQRIPEEIRVNSGVENVDAAVVARRSHERVVPVELRRPYCLKSLM